MLQLFRSNQSKLQEAEQLTCFAADCRYFDDIGWVAMHSRLGKAGQ